jgi:hypothetical protein
MMMLNNKSSTILSSLAHLSPIKYILGTSYDLTENQRSYNKSTVVDRTYMAISAIPIIGRITASSIYRYFNNEFASPQSSPSRRTTLNSELDGLNNEENLRLNLFSNTFKKEVADREGLDRNITLSRLSELENNNLDNVNGNYLAAFVATCANNINIISSNLNEFQSASDALHDQYSKNIKREFVSTPTEVDTFYKDRDPEVILKNFYELLRRRDTRYEDGLSDYSNQKLNRVLLDVIYSPLNTPFRVMSAINKTVINGVESITNGRGEFSVATFLRKNQISPYAFSHFSSKAGNLQAASNVFNKHGIAPYDMLDNGTLSNNLLAISMIGYPFNNIGYGTNALQQPVEIQGAGLTYIGEALDKIAIQTANAIERTYNKLIKLGKEPADITAEELLTPILIRYGQFSELKGTVADHSLFGNKNSVTEEIFSYSAALLVKVLSDHQPEMYKDLLYLALKPSLIQHDKKLNNIQKAELKELNQELKISDSINKKYSQKFADIAGISEYDSNKVQNLTKLLSLSLNDMVSSKFAPIIDINELKKDLFGFKDKSDSESLNKFSERSKKFKDSLVLYYTEGEEVKGLQELTSIIKNTIQTSEISTHSERRTLSDKLSKIIGEVTPDNIEILNIITRHLNNDGAIINKESLEQEFSRKNLVYSDLSSIQKSISDSKKEFSERTEANTGKDLGKYFIDSLKLSQQNIADLSFIESNARKSSRNFNNYADIITEDLNNDFGELLYTRGCKSVIPSVSKLLSDRPQIVEALHNYKGIFNEIAKSNFKNTVYEYSLEHKGKTQSDNPQQDQCYTKYTKRLKLPDNSVTIEDASFIGYIKKLFLEKVTETGESNKILQK